MDKSQVSPADVRAQLERMLASETFRGAERSKTLLSFIVEEAVQGRTDRLKDYTLGAEALGRGDQFDPRVDPIARVEASRLRSRLDLYYATEGADDPLRILLPKGGYVPQFEAHPIATTTSPPEALPAQPAALDPPPRANRLRQRPWLLAGIAVRLGLLAVTATSTFVRGPWRAPAAPEGRYYIPTPPTTDPVSIAISPDGRAIVFVATKGGRSQLWLRWMHSFEPRQLPGTDNASLPFWAPDSRSIGFFAESRIKRIDIENEVVRELSTALVPAGATWNRDGVILHPIVTDSPIFRTSVDGAPLSLASELLPGQTGHRAPVFLPDGRRFLLYATGSPDVSGIYLGELGTTTIRRLLAADAPAVLAPPRHLLYLQGSKLLAREFDPETMTLVPGEGVALADGVITEAAAGLPAVSASATGTIVFRTGQTGVQRQFVLVDRTGTQLRRIGPAAARPSYASISPDGRRLAIQGTIAGNTDVSIFDVNRGTASRFTDDPQPDISPVWSPDEGRIVYSSLVDGVFQLFEKRLDGTPARLLLRTAQSKQATDWSRNRNGSHLLFRTVAANFDIDIWALPLDSDGQPGTAFPVVQSRFEERDAQFSPDGEWIAYHSNHNGRHEVYVKPFPAGEPIRISTTTGGAQARWREDGRELFYLTLEGMLTAVAITVGPDGAIHTGAVESLFQVNVGDILGIAQQQYIVTDMGQRFLVDSVVEQAAAPISVILNWKASG